MLKIILGEEGSGASKSLCQDMIRACTADPSGSFIAIVPEQSTLQMQRQAVALHPSHVVMNIDITSFERLARKVFEELGESFGQMLDDTGKVLILRHVLEKCREDLDIYSKKVRMPGFAGVIKSMLSEFAQYDIDDNGLFLMQEKAIAAGNSLLGRKLQDIRMIRKSFKDALSERYTTAEDTLKAFARLVQKSEIIRGSHIYMDGFTGFTKVQYRLIEELMKYASDITIALTLPAGYEQEQKKPANMFFLSNKTYHSLLETAKRTGTQVRTVRIGSDEKQPAASERYSASDMTDEVSYITGIILDGVRNEGRRFRDFAVICSDMESYYSLFREIFSKAGIPCFIDYKSELADNVLARYIICAMGIVTDRFSYESVFAFLKNCMSGLSGDEICRLENYCLEFGINSYSSWTKEFEKNRRVHSEEHVFWNLEDINLLRKKVLVSLKDFYRDCSGSPKETGKYCTALKKLLERNSVKEKTLSISARYDTDGNESRAKEYEQIYEKTLSMLEQIAELTGRETVSQTDFYEMLKGAMKDLKISIIPPSLDQVVIGDLTRTRLEDVKILFMCGLNDGKIPSDNSLKGLLTDREREFLAESDFELAPDSLETVYSQYFYLYLMMSRPSEKLWLTYPGMDMQGEQLNPSCILEDAPGFHIPFSECEASADTSVGFEMSMWKNRAQKKLAEEIRHFVMAFREEGTAVLTSEAEQLIRYFALHDCTSLDQIFSGAFYESRALPIDVQTALDLYGDCLQGSISRFEKFFECPFKHFLNYGLKISERPEYEVHQTDIGTVYHDGLERYAKQLLKEGFSFRNVSDEKSHEIARMCISDAASQAQNDAFTSTKRNEYMLERMTSVMLKTTDILRTHVKQGLYEPSEFEMAFHDPDHPDTDFKGKIDRVDIYDADDIYVKVIDYKSGNKRFSIRDIYTGQSLQLVAYLKGAMNTEKEKHMHRNVRPGGVYYYLVQDRFVRDEKEAAEKFRMSGLTSCEPPALKAIDTETGFGASSTVVEISYTKTGLAGRSKVANNTEFASLIRFVDRKIDEASERIRSGDVSINPAYESAVKNACTYCDYRDICKFDPGRWGCDYNTLPDDTDTAAIEKEIYGRN